MNKETAPQGVPEAQGLGGGRGCPPWGLLPDPSPAPALLPVMLSLCWTSSHRWLGHHQRMPLRGDAEHHVGVMPNLRGDGAQGGSRGRSRPSAAAEDLSTPQSSFFGTKVIATHSRREGGFGQDPEHTCVQGLGLGEGARRRRHSPPGGPPGLAGVGQEPPTAG